MTTKELKDLAYRELIKSLHKYYKIEAVEEAEELVNPKYKEGWKNGK